MAFHFQGPVFYHLQSRQGTRMSEEPIELMGEGSGVERWGGMACDKVRMRVPAKGDSGFFTFQLLTYLLLKNNGNTDF